MKEIIIKRDFNLFFINTFLYFSILVCAGSPLLSRLFSGCGTRASHCTVFSRRGSRALGHRLSSCAAPA